MTVSWSPLVLPCVGRSAAGRRGVAGHGSSEMPVWAELFGEQLVEEPQAREITRLRAQAIAEHVHSLRRAH